MRAASSAPSRAAAAPATARVGYVQHASSQKRRCGRSEQPGAQIAEEATVVVVVGAAARPCCEEAAESARTFRPLSRDPERSLCRRARSAPIAPNGPKCRRSKLELCAIFCDPPVCRLASRAHLKGGRALEPASARAEGRPSALCLRHGHVGNRGEDGRWLSRAGYRSGLRATGAHPDAVAAANRLARTYSNKSAVCLHLKCWPVREPVVLSRSGEDLDGGRKRLVVVVWSVCHVVINIRVLPLDKATRNKLRFVEGRRLFTPAIVRLD